MELKNLKILRRKIPSKTRIFSFVCERNFEVRAIWKLCKFHLKMAFCVVFFCHSSWFAKRDACSRAFRYRKHTHTWHWEWNKVMAIFDNFVPCPIEISINMWASMAHNALFPFQFSPHPLALLSLYFTMSMTSCISILKCDFYISCASTWSHIQLCIERNL